MSKHLSTPPNIVENFAPGWFASVMGTAVIVVAIFSLHQFVPFAASLQLIFLLLALSLFAALIIPWLLRWVRYPAAVRRDFSNPVSAAFFPTMPISLLIIGLALDKTRLPLISENMNWAILQGLWIFGAAGIVLFALAILNTFFHQPEVKWENATLGWLIPPVSALLVPVLGSSLAGHFAGTPWGQVDLIGSLIFLGIGSLLFIFIMSLVFGRYIFFAMPPTHLTATLWVGLAPTSILTIISLRLINPAQKVLAFSQTTADTLNTLALIVGIAFWGFALFWALLSLLVTWRTRRVAGLPFALSWWAFVFPVGAFTVASGVLYQTLPYLFFRWVGLLALLALLALWLITAGHTLQGVRNRSIFAPHSPKPATKSA